MCDWQQKHFSLSGSMAGKSPEQYFRHDITDKVELINVKEGKCGCGNNLPISRLQGSFPRPLCDDCFNKLVNINAKIDECLLCGNQLSPLQIRLKKSNPREIQNAFCQGEGECVEFYAYLTGLITGHFKHGKVPHETSAIQSVFARTVTSNIDDDNCSYIKVPEPLALPAPGLFLEEPKEQLNVPLFFNNHGQVKEVEMKRKKEPILAKYKIIDV